MRFGMFAGVVLTVAAPALAQGGAERLASPAVSGFVTGYSAANARQSIREGVPRGETVEHWTRMITTQWFAGLAARTTPAQYAQTMLSKLPQQCPGARISPVSNLTVSGRPAVRFQVDCPLGTGETFILLAIAGQRDMHVKQVAFRGGAPRSALIWANAFLGGTVLCGAGSREAACR